MDLVGLGGGGDLRFPVMVVGTESLGAGLGAIGTESIGSGLGTVGVESIGVGLGIVGTESIGAGLGIVGAKLDISITGTDSDGKRY